jgi:hypothetical protein
MRICKTVVIDVALVEVREDSEKHRNARVHTARSTGDIGQKAIVGSGEIVRGKDNLLEVIHTLGTSGGFAYSLHGHQ